MSDQQLDIEQLRQDIKRQMKFQRQAGRYGMLGAHIGMFVLFSILNIIFLSQAGKIDALQNLPKGDAGFIITPIILLWIGWGSGVFFHLMAVLNEMGLFEKANKRMLVSRAVADQLLREVGSDSEKPKRKPLAKPEMRLTDEGELAPIEEDDFMETPKARTANGRR
jgi:hypothetical protein